MGHRRWPPPASLDGRRDRLVERNHSRTRVAMRPLGNALVWISLLVGLPCVLSALTLGSVGGMQTRTSSHPDTCAFCRHYRALEVLPPVIEEGNVVLVSPGHPLG